MEPGVNTLLIRVETSSTVFVPLFFATYGASAAAQENLMGFNGAFYGVLLAMFCYNLFLYLSLRGSAYLWYLAYNLNVGLLASLDGLGLDAMSRLLGRWGMRTERCQTPERLQDYLEDFAAGAEVTLAR